VNEGISREEKYEQLLAQTDPQSDFERVVLQEIYQRRYKLPDRAQELIAEANCKPDFLYAEERIAVFCDGSAHDRLDRQKQDRIDRDDLRYHTNYAVLTLRYDEDWRVILETLGSL
jgi:very-short-patch-repair endonuclease